MRMRKENGFLDQHSVCLRPTQVSSQGRDSWQGSSSCISMRMVLTPPRQTSMQQKSHMNYFIPAITGDSHALLSWEGSRGLSPSPNSRPPHCCSVNRIARCTCSDDSTLGGECLYWRHIRAWCIPWNCSPCLWMKWQGMWLNGSIWTEDSRNENRRVTKC